MNRDDVVLWSLISDISQSMQISFASIKAATSSLLGGDIFWDQATQHEFMQTVDHSVDGLSDLTAIMTTAMRAQSQTLTVRREPNSLQEILSRAKDDTQRRIPRARITLALPAETRLALVDYDWLLMALRLLTEALISTREQPTAPLEIQLQEDAAGWQIVFACHFSGLAAGVVNWFCYQAPESALLPSNLRAEMKLKILTAQRLLMLHAVTMAAGITRDSGRDSLVLHIAADAND